VPLLELKAISLPTRLGKCSNNTLALAKVACPHRLISKVGVNHLMDIGLSLIFTKAVSERLFSDAIDCIKLSEITDSKITTAAGFPEKRVDANASTWYIFNRMQLFYLKSISRLE
jgi:hypothetical protein